jgi:hypothetical protein
MPGDRKSIAPIASRVAPEDEAQLHHFVADSPWKKALRTRYARRTMNQFASVGSLALCAWVATGMSAWRMFKNRAALAKRDVLIGTPLVRISDAPGGGLRCVVQGQAKASEQGTVAAPISERPVVWYRLIVEEYVNESFETRLESSEGRDFELDDGSGVAARIEAHGDALTRCETTLLFDKREIAKCSLFQPLPDAVERYLSSRNISTRGLLGTRRQLRIREEAIAPGDSVLVFGQATHCAALPSVEPRGYRSSALRSLHFRADVDLLLSHQDKQSTLDALTAPVSKSAALCCGCACVGAILTLIAFVAP